MLSSFAFLTAIALSASLVVASKYSVSDTFIGPSFYDGFTAQAMADPTHGRVNYVSQSQAKSLNLTYAHGDTFIMRADHTTTLSANGPGRNSVRLKSNKMWGNSLVVADIRHMPQGCGTWPAFWSVGNNWPSGGEIDVLEGVNDQGTDQASLHTGTGCVMPSSGVPGTGIIAGTDCNANNNGNAGCGFKSNDASSYGPTFNNNGGGWYAMERSSTYIKVWFWPRNCANVPPAVQNGSGTADTSTFGTPFANFVNNNCDIPSHFDSHNIIINLTFCGDWAGQPSIYASSGCPGTCIDYVNNHPDAFAGAYFDFAALRVYQ